MTYNRADELGHELGEYEDGEKLLDGFTAAYSLARLRQVPKRFEQVVSFEGEGYRRRQLDKVAQLVLSFE